MKLLLELSGEHPELPAAELESVLWGEGIGFVVEEEYPRERLLLVDVAGGDFGFVKRLALCKRVGIVLVRGREVEELSEEISALIAGDSSILPSIAVRGKKRSVVEELGGFLVDSGHRVDLGNPDVLIRVYNVDGDFIVVSEIAVQRCFEKRKAQHRPFFSPISLHPKLARVMVNLAELAPGQTLLDPFCGTGGILIEAGLCGMELVGWDVKQEMVDGTKQNLLHYGLDGVIERHDALAAGDGGNSIDAVVTDPPYGRSSFKGGRDVGELYGGFLENMGGLLGSGRHLVVMFPKGYRPENERFKVSASFEVYVHKSLTRCLWKLQRI